MKEVLDELTFREIIGYSIVAEKASRKTYLEFAENVVGELKGKKFRKLAEEEEMHSHELKKIHQNEFGDKKIKFPKDKELPPHEAEIDVGTTESMIESLQAARQNELNAEKIYRYLAKEKKLYKDTFEHLANMERKHYDILKDEVDFHTDGKDQSPGEDITPDPKEIGKESTFVR